MDFTYGQSQQFASRRLVDLLHCCIYSRTIASISSTRHTIFVYICPERGYRYALFSSFQAVSCYVYLFCDCSPTVGLFVSYSHICYRVKSHHHTIKVLLVCLARFFQRDRCLVHVGQIDNHSIILMFHVVFYNWVCSCMLTCSDYIL